MSGLMDFMVSERVKVFFFGFFEMTSVRFTELSDVNVPTSEALQSTEVG